MRLRKECPHGLYDPHPRWVEPGFTVTCPGGEFLADDTLVAEIETDLLIDELFRRGLTVT